MTSAVGAGLQEEWETVIHFLCLCLSFTRFRNKSFSFPFLVCLAELSSIDIKDVVSFIKLSN